MFPEVWTTVPKRLATCSEVIVVNNVNIASLVMTTNWIMGPSDLNLWPPITKIYCVQYWIQIKLCAKFEDIFYQCSWDMELKMMGSRPPQVSPSQRHKKNHLTSSAMIMKYCVMLSRCSSSELTSAQSIKRSINSFQIAKLMFFLLAIQDYFLNCDVFVMSNKSPQNTSKDLSSGSCMTFDPLWVVFSFLCGRVTQKKITLE